MNFQVTQADKGILFLFEILVLHNKQTILPAPTVHCTLPFCIELCSGQRVKVCRLYNLGLLLKIN